MKNLNPAEWTYLACYYIGGSEAAADAMAEDTAEASRAMDAAPRHPESKTITKGLPAGEIDNLNGVCDHCGTPHAWGAVFRHTTGTVMAVGHDCAEVFNLPDIAAAKRRRAEQAMEAARERRATRIHNLREIVKLARQEPAVRAWWRSASRFASDLRAKVDQYAFTGRQLDAILDAAKRDAERAAKPVDGRECLQPAAPAPTGRWIGRLRLIHWKDQESEYGTTTKGLFQHPTDGWKVWMTVPAAWSLERGAEEEVTVTLEPKADDCTFAWGKRPTVKKAKGA